MPSCCLARCSIWLKLSRADRGMGRACYKMSQRRTSQRWDEFDTCHDVLPSLSACWIYSSLDASSFCVREGSAVLAASKCLQTGPSYAKLLVAAFPTCSYEMRVLAPALLLIVLADGTLASNGQCKAGEERDFSSFLNCHFCRQVFSYLCRLFSASDR